MSAVISYSVSLAASAFIYGNADGVQPNCDFIFKKNSRRPQRAFQPVKRQWPGLRPWPILNNSGGLYERDLVNGGSG